MNSLERYEKIMFCDYPDVVTVKELAQMLKISVKTAYVLLQDKKIPSIRVGRQYLVVKLDVIAFLMKK